MSFLDALADRLKVGYPHKKPQGQDNNIHRVWSQAPRSETTRLPNLYHQSPRLDPVELIASTIAQSELQLFDKAKLRRDPDNADPVENHPLLDLLENPSPMFPEIDGYTLKYVTAVLVELLGECFWVKIRAGRQIAELLPFPPSWCITTPTQGNPVFLFQPFGTTSGRTIQVAPEDVVWFKQADISDPYGRGRGRTEAVGGELDSDEMAEKWQKNYFYNDATPPFWANIPGAQTGDLERMRDTWAQRIGGWLNVRKPAFTNGEGLQIVKLGDTAKEVDFVESRRYLRDVFLQHYAIPPEMFGILENSNRSTIDSAYYLLAKNVITRRLGFYERAINRQLVQPDFDARLEARFDFEVPEDEAFRLQKVNEGLARGALTRADWKRAMGYDVEPGDDVYVMPMGLVEVPKGERKEAPAQEPEPEPEPPAKPKPKEDDKQLTLDLFIVKAEPKPLDSRKAAHWKAADTRARQNEGMFRSRIRAYADVQQSRLSKAMKKYPPKEYGKAIDEAFSGADNALMHAMAPAWIATMVDGAQTGRDYLGLKASPSFELYNREFDKWVKRFGLKKAKEINETTNEMLRRDLSRELAAGIEAGESIPNLADRMERATAGVYENMSLARAELIARTETMSSVNYGQQVVYATEGVEKRGWLSTPDQDTRDDHRVGIKWGDAMEVGIDDPFEVGGETLMYPGDPTASAGNVCNCRCTIYPVIDLKGDR